MKKTLLLLMLPGSLALAQSTSPQYASAQSDLANIHLVASEVKASPMLPQSRFYKASSSDVAPRLVALDAPPRMVGPYTTLAYNAYRKKLIVRFDNPLGSRVNINLTDEKGLDLYWNSVVAPAILQRFDMSSAPNGRYTLTISRPYNKERYVQKIQLRSGVPMLIE